METNQLNAKVLEIRNIVTEYVENPFITEGADFTHQQNGVYIANEYNRVVLAYSDLLKFITKVQFFISECKVTISKLGKSNLELNTKAVFQKAIDLVETYMIPIYNEKERLKTLEMMFRNLYNRFGM